MFKKTFAILIALAIVGVLAYGVVASGAWFTDAASINNNYVTTGALDLAVSGGPFTGTNLEPGGGYQSLGWFCVENVGEYNMKWRGWVYDLVDNKGLADYLLVKAIIRPDDHPGNYGPANTVIFNDVPFTSLVGENSHIVLDNPADAFVLGHIACYDIQARLLETAPNAVQDAQLYAKFYIQGTQRINPGWGE